MSRSTGRFIAAFSLIEILISIVVLSLGLLGLAAVFPAVVRQQRIATDSVQGVSIERTAQEYIRNSGTLNAFNPQAGGVNSRAGWQMLTYNAGWSPRGLWVLSEPSLAGLPGTGVDLPTGVMTMGTGDNQAFVSLTDRLIPHPYSTGNDPRFVWDFVTRRIIAGDPGLASDDQVQVAVFVRRIDAGIRRGSRSLADMFTGLGAPMPTTQRRVPVAVDDEGRPTADGLGGVAGGANGPVYSRITDIGFTPYPAGAGNSREPVDAISFDEDAAGLYKYASQIGQKLVDQTGVVHEVVDFVRENDSSTGRIVAVRITPEISPLLVALGNSDEIYWRMAYTPQVPAGVKVFTLTPGSNQ